ncbi:carbohydrate kinase family protein [Rhizobium pusense]|uniref:carbohydrate kinase family protein n=1 Tax=Agrobacterium pusense TaxID=648995 RepID=UPI00244B8844|nr:carbohydrate kinase family protein [Agrobacterium pusense]MDH1271626.1 carbohydrate kinase family protein [Agrobacterium pusense]
MERARVLVVGYLSIDTVTSPDGEIQTLPGGAALYASLGARQLGVTVDIASSIGSDYPAEWLQALKTAGIGIDHIRELSVPTRWATIVHLPDGRRESRHFKDPAWRLASENHRPLWPDDLSEYDVIVACPMPAAYLAKLLDEATAISKAVVADINEATAEEEGEAVRALLSRLDIFAPSREETRLLYPTLDDVTAALQIASAGTNVIQKLGAAGLRVVERCGTSEKSIPALTTVVVDPTGAGDATVGAIGAARAIGLSIFPAANAALSIGALAVTGRGPAALGTVFVEIKQERADRGTHL